MALETDIQILSGVDLFSELTPEQLRLLAFGAEALSVPEGQEIYREGAPADCAYVVVSGQVVLYTQLDGNAVALERLGPGAILGELALIAQTSRLTYAASETDVELLRLNRSLFRRILEEYPEAAAALHQHISEELQNLVSKIEAMASKFAD